MNFHCLIIDDEPLARKVIEKHLSAYSQFTLDGSCENALIAFELLNKKQIDLIFLDIQLPGVNGLQFIQSLKNPPAVIFTTAYSEHAAESYDLEAIDYLLKPITSDRFTRAINKFLKQAEIEKEEEKKTFLFIKENGKLVKVFYDDILYVESRKDYLMIYTNTNSLITHMTMKTMEELLPADQFRRVHRSFIIATGRVTGVGNNQLELKNKIIPLGEKYKKVVLEYFQKLG